MNWHEAAKAMEDGKRVRNPLMREEDLYLFMHEGTTFMRKAEGYTGPDVSFMTVELAGSRSWRVVDASPDELCVEAEHCFCHDLSTVWREVQELADTLARIATAAQPRTPGRCRC